mgnify:FL=1
MSDTAAVHPGITRIREKWEALFGYLAEEDAIVVVDEFPYLVEPALPDFVSGTFDQLCQQALLYEYGDQDRFVEGPTNWKDGRGREIDIVVPTDGETLVVGEAKSRRQPVGYDVLSQLENETPLLDWTPESGGVPDYQYALFGRTGFKQSVTEAAEERDDIRLFTVDDVVRTLSN